MSTFRDASRGEFTSGNTVEHINTGSLQRIADAVEKVAQNYDSLVRAKQQAEKARDYWSDRTHKLERKVRALRGHITRLKRR